MKVLFITAEIAPFAKVGGLADVAASLPPALAEQGCEVVVFCPAYGSLIGSEQASTRPLVQPFYVRVNASRFVSGTLYETVADDLRIWSAESVNSPFSRVSSSEDIYTFQRDDYLFLARAAIEACEEMNWIPDVVHCHDWHTGFLPPMIRHSTGPRWQNTGVVFTIHNLAYQGEFGFETLDAAGLPHWMYQPDYCEAYGAVNFLKSGAVFADHVNTVSPTYAEEIQTEEFGCRLEGFMRHLASRNRLSGILNGIDTEAWNPATDPAIAARFSRNDLAGKAKCRAELLRIAEFPDAEGPVFGMVTRLSSQKGFDLVLQAIPRLIGAGGSLIVQGLGDPAIAQELDRQARANPGRIRIFERFDAELAQKIYAGSDAFLMPSRFEPCGLGQMFAMRYGTVPVVRATGGLADTVFDGENGFTFDDFAASALAETIERACRAFSDPKNWQKLIAAGLSADHTWPRSAAQYRDLYRKVAKGKLPAAAATTAP